MNDIVYNKSDSSLIRSNCPTNLSVVEAATYIGVSVRSLRSCIARHEIKHVRFGARVLLRKVDIDDFLESKVA